MNLCFTKVFFEVYIQLLPTIWENIYIILMDGVSVWDIVSQKKGRYFRKKQIYI